MAVVALAGGGFWLFAGDNDDSDSAAEPSIFGSWQSTDTDGSTQWLWVESNGTGAYDVTYHDEGASGCDDNLEVAATLNALGLPAGENAVELAPSHVLCLFPDGEIELPGTVAITFFYDPATDTVTDSFADLKWHRTQTAKESVIGS